MTDGATYLSQAMVGEWENPLPEAEHAFVGLLGLMLWPNRPEQREHFQLWAKAREATRQTAASKRAADRVRNIEVSLPDWRHVLLKRQWEGFARKHNRTAGEFMDQFLSDPAAGELLLVPPPPLESALSEWRTVAALANYIMRIHTRSPELPATLSRASTVVDGTRGADKAIRHGERSHIGAWGSHKNVIHLICAAVIVNIDADLEARESPFAIARRFLTDHARQEAFFGVAAGISDILLGVPPSHGGTVVKMGNLLSIPDHEGFGPAAPWLTPLSEDERKAYNSHRA